MINDRPRLVFGDDGSAAADVVWLWISNHSWAGWLVSVVTARRSEPWTPESAKRPPVESTGTRLLRDGDNTSVETLVLDADPRVVLNSFQDAALLAVGPRGKGLLKHLHIGSTTEWLLHQPPAPLALIRSARPTRHVLLCVDGSAPAERAVQAVARLPWIVGCRVTVLGVVEDAHGPAGPVDAGQVIADAAKVLQQAGATVEERLMGALRGTHIFDVRSAILDEIAEDSPDLVAMGTRGVGGVQRLLLGSTASAVAHHAPCSVLVVPGRQTGPEAEPPAATDT